MAATAHSCPPGRTARGRLARIHLCSTPGIAQCVAAGISETMWHFTYATLLPTIGLALTGGLLVYAVYLRFVDIPGKWVLTPRALWLLMALALLGDGLVALRLYSAHSARQTWQDGAALRASRERFVLPQDFQYGELLIPAGSLINRKDPFDKGEPGRALALHGLEAVRFAQPVQVAGVWATALQLHPPRVELAQEQRIGPLYRFDSTTQSWAPNKVMPALLCRKGQMAVFQVPHIAYNVQAELDKPPPDGPDARFMPSQWLFRSCENGPALAVEPAPGAGAPAAASTAR